MDSYGFLGIPGDYYNVLWITNDHVAEKQVMAVSVVIDNDADNWSLCGRPIHSKPDHLGFLWIPNDSHGFLAIPVDCCNFLWILRDSSIFLWISTDC